MLPVVTIHREYRINCTLGTLLMPNGKILKTMERPWLCNLRNRSCIPEGEYLCRWLPRSASGKYKRVWIVEGVTGRSGVLFHVGNLVRNTRGCILPGLRHGHLNGFDAVLASGSGLSAMRRQLSGSNFKLIITS